MDMLDGDGAFADCGCDSLDRTVTYVTDCEHASEARLEQSNP
jgi:hypothetical protein